MIRKGANLGRRPKARTKITIKPFKVKPTLPANYFDESWNKLRTAVASIYGNSGAGGSSLEELYSLVDNLCSYKHAAELHTKLMAELESIHVRMGAELAARARELDGPRLLSAMDGVYTQAAEHLLLVRQVFLVLDRSYVIATPRLTSLWASGLALIRKHVLAAHPALLSGVVGALVDGITAERSGHAVDSEIVVRLVQMLVALQLYEDHVEAKFVDATAAFYAQEGGVKLAQLGLPSYLAHVQARITEESERLTRYGTVALSGERVLALVDEHLIRANVEVVLEQGGLSELLNASMHEPLATLYGLLGRVSALPALCTAIRGYVESTGTAIVSDPAKDKGMVDALIELHTRVLAVVEGPFQNNPDIGYALKDAFEKFINVRQNRPAELIAKYMDKLLKSSAGKGSDEDVLLGKLDAGLALFRFVSGKDVFEAFYKKDLAKRLLLGKSASADAEKAMVARLRDECGSTFANKLEGMMKDIELSRELNASWSEGGSAASVAMFAHVLTMGFWPTYPEHTVLLPPDMAGHVDDFEAFYKTKHSGRKLKWQHSLATVSLGAVFPSAGKRCWPSRSSRPLSCCCSTTATRCLLPTSRRRPNWTTRNWCERCSHCVQASPRPASCSRAPRASLSAATTSSPSTPPLPTRCSRSRSTRSRSARPRPRPRRPRPASSRTASTSSTQPLSAS
ncbi:Cullin 4 [Thecamonas trahens ATCC 50062]|uniref:Cullin 4 n=1 Tax=Thecamonas trahens ATCC 50062 TaxID=461836 RepID=A0A0L0DDL6_THETB|nr:Cullin 4 [Thecamonas trahens ATCC 50062]KNC49408.1 Cullin 4 [Thecamonas trahens ATCC 50062]|eukprot:XP_013757832.1 Cullin 4 [Thecamonas trahens ATCC 50062]